MENTEDLVIINVAPTDGAFRAFMAEGKKQKALREVPNAPALQEQY